MIVPDYVWSHIAGWFLGSMTLLSVGWFASITKRLTDLEAEVAILEEEVSKKSKVIERLRMRLFSLGSDPSEACDE